jgi:hypothetical protein
MPISETYRCARALEAIENYARADGPLVEEVGDAADPSAEPTVIEPDDYGHAERRFDEQFWTQVLADREAWWGRTFMLPWVGLSEWVARVPGLFWSPHARGMRELARESVDYRSHDWTTYLPVGKSAIVLGGVGTVKLPPNENGCRLVTLSGGHNASSGIPALVFPEVWEHPGLRGVSPSHLQEGDVITIRAQWQEMAWGWARRFPVIADIPMGYLVLKNPDDVLEVVGRGAPTQFHPYTVMEYEQGDIRLWDFVYATVDTRFERHRDRVIDFFARYKDQHDRNGTYLTAANVSNPMWDAVYADPVALRQTRQGRTQLELLKERVYQHSFRWQTIEEILQILAHNYRPASFQRLATYINIPWGQVPEPASPAELAAELMQRCLQRKDEGKLEELLDAIARDNARLLMSGD